MNLNDLKVLLEQHFEDVDVYQPIPDDDPVPDSLSFFHENIFFHVEMHNDLVELYSDHSILICSHGVFDIHQGSSPSLPQILIPISSIKDLVLSFVDSKKHG